jgi:hypothetical protein
MLQLTSRNQFSKIASCPVCDAAFVVRRPWQHFCSARCRLAAHRREMHAPQGQSTLPTGTPKIIAVQPNPSGKTHQNQSTQNAFQQGVRAPHHVIEAEVFGGRAWRQAVSSDGVAYEVSTLRKRALRDGGAS